MCESSGAAYITVHGRTRSDFYSGTADWDIIAEVKNAVKIPVIGNGDITSPEKARRMIEYTGVDGVMVARASLGNPWLISQIHNYLEEGIDPQPLSLADVHRTLLSHINGLVEYYGERTALGLSRKYVCWYCKNLHDARKFRENYMKINTWPEALAEVERYFTSLGE